MGRAYPQPVIISDVIAASDETTVLVTGTAVVTFRMPTAFTLTGIKASLTTAAATGTFAVDVNAGGTSIMTTTKLRFDATEDTTVTYSGTAAALTQVDIADDAVITIDIDDAGSAADATGLKVTLLGYKP